MKNRNNFVVEVTSMESFAEMVKTIVESYYSDDYSIMIHPVPRNNDLPRIGLCIKDGCTNISPVIYLDKYYKRYAKGETLVSLCKEIIATYEEIKVSIDFDMSMIVDFKKVQETICLRLVNAKMNQELLQNVPHLMFHDLAMVFYILLSKGGKELATITVQNNYLDVWGVGVEEVYQYAVRNTKYFFDIIVTPVFDMIMRDFLGDMNDETAEELYELLGMDTGKVPLYKVTNQEEMFGATILLNKEFLREFADDLDSDLFIIPASIHDLLIIPTSTDAEVDILKAIIKEVNATDVPEAEILSDNIYTYYRLTDQVEMN